jgi:hypothetical protein
MDLRRDRDGVKAQLSVHGGVGARVCIRAKESSCCVCFCVHVCVFVGGREQSSGMHWGVKI